MNIRQVKRSTFQFHFSTAMLMMLAAGGLMWLNFTPMVTHQRSPPGILTTFGIPCPVCEIWEGIENIGNPVESRSFGFPFVMDLCFGVIILFVIWYLCDGRRMALMRSRPIKSAA